MDTFLSSHVQKSQIVAYLRVQILREFLLEQELLECLPQLVFLRFEVYLLFVDLGDEFERNLLDLLIVNQCLDSEGEVLVVALNQVA